MLICTPDKDLGQCVGNKVVQWDRRRDVVLDAAGVREKFGVDPASIPDYLALVGDSADGFPGLPGWGAKSAAAVLARYGSIDAIPSPPERWDVDVRGAAKLAGVLVAGRRDVEVFRELARLVTDAEVGAVADWEWRGARDDVDEWAARLDAKSYLERVHALTERRR